MRSCCNLGVESGAGVSADLLLSQGGGPGGVGRPGLGSLSEHAQRRGGAGAGLSATSRAVAAAVAAAEFGLLRGRKVRGRPAQKNQYVEPGHGR